MMSLEVLGYVIVAILALVGAYFLWSASVPWLTGRGKVDASQLRLGDGIFALIVGVFFILLINQAVQNPAERNIPLTLPQIAQGAILYVFLAGSVILNLVLRGYLVWNVFGWKKATFGKALRSGMGYGLAAYPVVIACYLVTAHFLSDPKPQAMVEFFMQNSGIAPKLVVVAMAVVLAPLCEEILFRGYFYAVLKRFGGIWAATIVSALLFSAIHVDLAPMPALFLFGIFLVWIYEKSGSLKSPIFMHATFNAVSLLLSLIFPSL